MKGWLDKYVEGGDLDKNALSGVKNVLSAVGDVTSAPARGLTYLATGKYQDPSEAMGITNPYGAFATDMVLDPMNLVGAGLLKLASGPSKLSKVTKAASKLSKAADVTSAIKNYKSPDIKLDPNKFPGPKNIPINPKQFNQAVKSTLSALTERGQKLDQVTGGKFNVTPDDIHYHGTFAARPIVEVKTPHGSEYFYKSTGWGGKKEVDPGQWQVFGQWMDAPAGTVKPNSVNDWFVKGKGFDQFYGSQSFGNVANSLDNALIKKYNVPPEDLNKFLNFQNMQSDANTFIPKRKDGGWLDKYNDGGPIQPNYNDYSVSAGPGFEGDGYSNVGRNYSPAWGGQFKEGGEVQPIYVTDKKDSRLKAYKDSLDSWKSGVSYNKLLKTYSGTLTNSYDLITDPKKISKIKTDSKVKPTSGLFFNRDKYIKSLIAGKEAPHLNPEPEKAKRLGGTKYDNGNYYNKDHAMLVADMYSFKKPTQPIIYQTPEPTPQSTIDFMEGNYAQEPITEIPQPQPQASAYGEVVDPRTGYIHMTRQGSSMYPMVGQNVPEMEDGGAVKRFMQPTETFKNYGYNPIEKGMSTEYSTSIGGPGEVYLVPGFRQGRLLQDPEGVFNTYGEHLGGPFKTVKSAEDFGKLRHKYVEQNKDIPAPFKTRDYAMGGSIGGATQGIPGATGFMYSRDSGSNPSEDKGRNKVYKTDASAQNGKEMKFYQEGLDFKPKSISKNGSVIKDDMGQWAHPGEITEIGSNQITMQGVPYPVLGISDTGDMQMMYPDEDYVYDGESVTEIPMMREGGTISKKTLARNQRIAESNAAQNQPLTPESLAIRAIAIPDKLRLSEQMRNISPDLAGWMEENPTMSYIDENLNPLVIAGKLASKLGQVPLNVKQGNYRQALLNTISPMLVRASATGAVTTENLSNSKNKFEQGGQLTKLDQLTNFTNYNTKQPGGWLDKYNN